MRYGAVSATLSSAGGAPQAKADKFLINDLALEGMRPNDI